MYDISVYYYKKTDKRETRACVCARKLQKKLLQYEHAGAHENAMRGRRVTRTRGRKMRGMHLKINRTRPGARGNGRANERDDMVRAATYTHTISGVRVRSARYHLARQWYSHIAAARRSDVNRFERGRTHVKMIIHKRCRTTARSSRAWGFPPSKMWCHHHAKTARREQPSRLSPPPRAQARRAACARR